MTLSQKWIASLLMTSLAVLISYLWIDRAVALFVHDRLGQIGYFQLLTRIPEPLAALAVLALVVLGILGLMGHPMSRIQATTLLCSLSLIVAEAIKDQLKLVFGRTWPETWVQNNPSFIHDGVYGFNPFHAGPAFRSFPSGHMAAIWVIASILWICYPKFRALYMLAVAAVAIGLIGSDYHFVSDVVAGGFLGASTAVIAVALWERDDRPRLTSEPKPH